MPYTTKQQSLGLIAWLAVCYTAAVVGMLATMNAPEIYNALTQPSWAPPSSVFGPVWTILYTLIAISAWLVWRTTAYGSAQQALGFFIIQLVINACWSWLFFNFLSGLWSFVNIIFLVVFAAITMVLFFKRSVAAGVLFIPYLAWICFATALNFTVWQLNPEILG
jgi:benzodiazapine receptor